MKKSRLKSLALALVGGGLMISLTGCGYNIPSDMVAVHITKGPFQAKKVVGCVDSSQRKYWTNDDYPLFPTSEREWDATGQKGSDSTTFQSVTKDKVIMDIPVTVRFSLIVPSEIALDNMGLATRSTLRGKFFCISASTWGVTPGPAAARR